MKRPDNWDSIQAWTGEGEALPAGNYVCRILAASDTISKSNKPMLVMYIDIAEGEYAGFFTRKYEAAKKSNPTAKFPAGGIYRQTHDETNEKSMSMFKGLTNAIEESNPGYKWDWDEAKLKGKRVAGQFRREEFVTSDGVTTAFPTKCAMMRSLTALANGELKVLADKYLVGSAPKITTTYANESKFEEVPGDDDFPF